MLEKRNLYFRFYSQRGNKKGSNLQNITTNASSVSADIKHLLTTAAAQVTALLFTITSNFFSSNLQVSVTKNCWYLGFEYVA